jgi:hypothetical protein
LPPQFPQLVPHVCPAPHVTHTWPPVPHAPFVLPSSHAEPEQHPVHDEVSHAQTPLAQCCPDAQVPVAHAPPQASSAPQALPAQFGVQPHTPGLPPPPQVSGFAQPLPAQHACPLPPHPAHVVPQVVPDAHATHATPPLPQAVWSFPDSQLFPLQQPPHDATSHLHTPATHRVPEPHPPCVQTDAHPSLSPHALPAQLGVHVPVPQTLCVPPPPQSRPISHPPQSVSRPQASSN